MQNLVWCEFWWDHFLARILGCCVNVFFKAMLDVQIICTSSTGCRLLITYSFIDLSHIMNWHFLEIATWCIKFLCSSDISADLFLLFAGCLSVVTLRAILATRRDFGSICNHVAPIRTLDKDPIGLMLDLLQTVCFFNTGVIVRIHAQLLFYFL